jgi:radical SAM superfamily enzyme YgiQ (UPF0313 family)
MRLTLVKPNIGRLEHSLYVDEGRMEPLQLGVLGGLTPPGWDLRLYDDRMEAIPYDEPTDLVAITVETYTALRAYEIAAAYRARGVPVIMGGFQATLLPDEVGQHADSVYIGDAEQGWSQVLDDVRRGQLEKVYRFGTGVGQGSTLPRRDLFRGKGYLPITLMQFLRGCAFACTYCAVSVYFDRKTHVRRIDDVLREIDDARPRMIFFVDDNIVADRRAAKDLFRELIAYRLRWVSQGSIDMTRDPELMDLMTRSGCMGHVIGFESISASSLRSMAKTPNLHGSEDGYREAIRVLRDHGLQTWAAFTLGHDDDTVDSIRATLDFALQNRFAFAAFNILVPYPSTPLYRSLEQEGRLLYDGKWWLHPDYRFNHAAFVPRHMSAETLTAECFRCRSHFNSVGSMVRRFLDPRTNLRSLARMALYWSYAPLFRKEVFKKQGMRFGADTTQPAATQTKSPAP